MLLFFSKTTRTHGVVYVCFVVVREIARDPWKVAFPVQYRQRAPRKACEKQQVLFAACGTTRGVFAFLPRLSGTTGQIRYDHF